MEDEILLVPSAEYNKNEENVIYVGLKLSDELLAVENSALDDAIYINVENNAGVITGNNPRSVLIAVISVFKRKGILFYSSEQRGRNLSRWA